MVSILIIDDEPKLVDVISAYFEKEGFQTVSVFNGKDALYHLKVFTIDLVILDLMLPDISGEELCEMIRDNYSIPILILSAKYGEDYESYDLSIGASDYIKKPFSPRELVLRAKNILRQTNL
jgi:two-component system, OmpR family, response regulator ResD